MYPYALESVLSMGPARDGPKLIKTALSQLYDCVGHADRIGRVWQDAIMHRLAEKAQPGGLQSSGPVLRLEVTCWGSSASVQGLIAEV